MMREALLPNFDLNVFYISSLRSSTGGSRGNKQRERERIKEKHVNLVVNHGDRLEKGNCRGELGKRGGNKITTGSKIKVSYVHVCENV